MVANFLKKSAPPKIVLLFAMNENEIGNYIQQIVNNFAESLGNKTSLANGNSISAFGNHFLVNFNSLTYPSFKNVDPVFFVSCPRNLESFLNYLKVADFVIGVSTVKYVDWANLNKTPADAINVIDELGNRAISLMRAQGQLPFVSNVIDFDKLDAPKKKTAKFYISRLIDEEFGKLGSCFFIEKNEDLIRTILHMQNTKKVTQTWRDTRGYFLVDKVELQTSDSIANLKLLKLSGYLRNSWGPDNVAHITGYGDFQQYVIEGELESKGNTQFKMCKNAFDPDDFRVVNNQGSTMNFENQNPKEHGIEIEGQNEDFEIDEFEEMKKEFAKMTFSENEGWLKRRPQHRHQSNRSQR